MVPTDLLSEHCESYGLPAAVVQTQAQFTSRLSSVCMRVGLGTSTNALRSDRGEGYYTVQRYHRRFLGAMQICIARISYSNMSVW